MVSGEDPWEAPAALIAGIGVPLALFALAGYSWYKGKQEVNVSSNEIKPQFIERAYMIPDFNRDGIEDLIIDSEKGRVTYLGKLENGSIVYYRDTMEVK